MAITNSQGYSGRVYTFLQHIAQNSAKNRPDLCSNLELRDTYTGVYLAILAGFTNVAGNELNAF